jgi:bifunctional enzyme CysN/CysC
MINFALHRATNVHHEHFLVDKAARAAALGQRPMVLWFTGLSGSGKSTVAKLVEQALHQAGRHTYSLDGDNLRHGLCSDLGFSAEDRRENLRRVAEVAALMVDAGLFVLAAFVSPSAEDRARVAGRLGADHWLEVHVATPLEVCEARDPKGHYAKARRGDLSSFTGISAPYEPPAAPDLRIDTVGITPSQAAGSVVAVMAARGWLKLDSETGPD